MLSFQKYISEWLELEEGKSKPGLWANIHAKRKRGERPARPGEEGYPKTLNIEEIDEAIKADDYVATSEKSQFGGHRPHVVNKSTGKTMHLSAHAYKSPEHAKAHAKEYVSAYSKIGPNAADRAGQAYAKANKDKLADKSVNEAVDPSEIAGNPKAYNVDAVKKAYYHKKVSASDKESLGRHLDRYHGHKEWHKPLVKEDTDQLDELSNDTLKSYAKKAGAEATGVKGKHLSPEKSNKRFDGHAKAMQRLTKESVDQLDELSKETLGSYKHKAELSIPNDDREYANRSKGIDRAEKKLKKEDVEQIDELSKKTIGSYVKKAANSLDQTAYSAGRHGVSGGLNDYIKSVKRRKGIEKAADRLTKEDVEQIDEMTQGKSYTQDQLRKKMQSGNWEATNDIKPGKHVEMRHHTGKRVMVHVKESVEQLDELSPNLLHRYVKKASGNMGMHAVDHGKYGDQQKDKKSLNKAVKRLSGIASASGRMADKANQNEEMTPTEKAAFLAAANKKASLEYWQRHAELKKNDPRVSKPLKKESVEDLDESEINDLTAKYINENNITLEQLENMTEAELNELIGAAIGGAFKLGAKAAVGAGRLAGRLAKKAVVNKQGNFRFGAQGKADAEKRALDREKAKDKAIRDRARFAKERQALKDRQNKEKQSNN
jgi:hypothetical protein